MKAAIQIMVVVVLFVAPSLGRADEGLWLFDQPPRQRLKDTYDFEPSDQWLQQLQKSTVELRGGGSGFLVSADGLVMTNHHVARKWLEELAVDRKDLLETGFLAGKRNQELRCPGLEIRVAWSIADVTARVHAAVKPDMSLAEASRARWETIRTLEKEASTGHDAEVIALNEGAQYRLHRCKKYTDVRLVFAPEKVPVSSSKLIAGRQNGVQYLTDHFDVCFFRAYEKGKPARPARYLTFASTLPKMDSLVLASGFPSLTYRFRTAAELDEMYGRQFLCEFKATGRQRYALESMARDNPELKNVIQQDLADLDLTLLYYTYGMNTTEKFLQARRVKEKNERAKLSEIDAELAARYQLACARIEKCQREGDHLSRRLFYLGELGASLNSRLLSFARYLVHRTFHDSRADPLPEGSRRQWDEEGRADFFSSRPISRKVESVKLADSLALFASHSAGDADLAAKLLDGKTPEERAASLVDGTRLDDLEFRRKLLKAGKDAVAASDDPMIVLARLIEGPARQAFKDYDVRILEPCRQAHAVLHSLRQKITAGPAYFDGSSSLRLSYGKVLACADCLSDYAAFHLPGKWQTPKNPFNLRVPMVLRVSVDGSFGNSGSPVVDRDGRVVGLLSSVSTSNGVLDFELAYSQESVYAGAISARGVVEVLARVYDAGALVKEIGGEQLLSDAMPDLPQPPSGFGGPPSLFPSPGAGPAFKPAPSVARRHADLVPTLIKALKDADAEVVQSTALALGNIGADAIPALVEAIKSRDKTLRAHAALALGKMGPAGQEAIPALLKALGDEEVIVRREAAKALAAVVQQVYWYPPPPIITDNPVPPGPPPSLPPPPFPPAPGPPAGK